MTRNKLIHIHSTAKDTAGTGPKLPTSDQIEYGEIAVNYLSGYETLSIKNSNDKIVKFSSSESIPTKTSQLTNDSGYITSSSLPTKVSELTNDSGFVTSSSIPKKISQLTDDLKINSRVTAIESELEFVDLGLPSGTKWASKNIGATSITNTGSYYQWGATTGHTGSDAMGYSTWSTCPGNGGYSSLDNDSFEDFVKNQMGSTNFLGKNVDASYTKRDDYRLIQMPTNTQINELYDNTNLTWYSNFGGSNVSGAKLASKTNPANYIFIPACGYFSDNGFYGNDYVWLWSNELIDTTTTKYQDSYIINILNDGSVDRDYGTFRYRALPIRPVLNVV